MLLIIGMYKNMVIVNVSPLGSYHILLVPNPQKCFPQVLTLENLNSIIEISLLSNSAYVKLIQKFAITKEKEYYSNFNFLGIFGLASTV